MEAYEVYWKEIRFHTLFSRRTMPSRAASIDAFLEFSAASAIATGSGLLSGGLSIKS